MKVEVGDYIEYKETHNWDNSIHTHRYTVKSIDGEAVAVLVQETGETERTDTMTREEFLLYIAPSLAGFSENGKSTIDTSFGTIRCAKYTQKETEDSVDMYLGKDGVLYKKEFIQKNFDESLHITIFDSLRPACLSDPSVHTISNKFIINRDDVPCRYFDIGRFSRHPRYFMIEFWCTRWVRSGRTARPSPEQPFDDVPMYQSVRHVPDHGIKG